VKINSKLNIVIEVEGEAGTFFVHSTPLSREVYERYFIIISQTFAKIISGGMSVISGPSIAALMLRKVAQDMNAWEGDDGVKNGLFAEMRRISNVVLPGPSGWQTMPLQSAINRQALSEDDVAEVEGIIAFFICTSAISRKNDLPPILDRLEAWGARATLLNCTEYAASLPISTPAETSTETQTALSVPH
jgi:hypothetical protein